VFEKTIRLFKQFSEELKKKDSTFIVELLATCLPKHEFS
jgi:hypothetical protein